MQSTSSRWVFNGIDLIKTARFCGIVAIGAVAAYLIQSVLPGAHPVTALGALELTVLSSGLEAIRRWATDHSQN